MQWLTVYQKQMLLKKMLLENHSPFALISPKVLSQTYHHDACLRPIERQKDFAGLSSACILEQVREQIMRLPYPYS
jgi:hypothetical protein